MSNHQVNSRRQPVKSKRRRKRRRGNNTLIYIMVFIVVAGIATALSLTVFFKVNQVDASGSKKYTSDEIVKASGITAGENLFMVDFSAAEENITTKLPYIIEADISRKFPDKINITVKEGSAATAYKLNDEWVLADKNDKVLETVKKLPDGVSIVETSVKAAVPGNKIEISDSGLADAIAKIRAAADSAGLKKITRIRVPDGTNISIVYDDRIILDLGTVSDLDERISYAKAAIDVMDENQQGILKLKWWTSSNKSVPFAGQTIKDELEGTSSEKEKTSSAVSEPKQPDDTDLASDGQTSKVTS